MSRVTMNSRLWHIILFVVCVSVFMPDALSQSTLKISSLDTAIDSIDTYLDKRSRYGMAKQQRISAVIGESDIDTPERAIAVGREYRRFNVDSAARYFGDAIEMARANADDEALRIAMLELSAVNPLRGVVKESVDMFESIDPSNLTPKDLLTYFDKGFDVYVTTAAFYDGNDLHDEYVEKALAFSDSLTRYLPEDSPHQFYHKGWSAMLRGDTSEALAELSAALRQSSFGDELYARVTASLADLYSTFLHDDDKAALFLSLSAMSDIAAGTKEMTSLQRLGLDLYRRGDIKRAYRYLTVALDNSIESGSKIRTIGELNILPVVTKAYNDKDAGRISWLYLLIVILSVALLILAVMSWIAYRSKKRLSAYRERLTASGIQKDAYISQVLAICSSYIERIEELNRLVLRKVKAGQGQDLCRMVESGEMMRAQSDKFLRTFDTAFLSIYPDFVVCLNEMLRSDARFPDPVDGKLTPELRIAAFMRLGVDDSARIARLLGLSLNTVYTYRNKLRNRAIDRDNFENSIKNIGNIAK